MPVGGTSKLPVSGKVGEFTCLSSAAGDSSVSNAADFRESEPASRRSDTADDDPRGKIVIMPSAEHPDARVGENPDYEMDRFLSESGMRAYKPSRKEIEYLQRTLELHH